MRSRVLGLAAITLTSALGFTGAIGEAQTQTAAARSTTAAKSKVPRTPWGDPDLQGTWDYRTITPLERNRELGTREFYTEEEKKTLEDRAGRRMDTAPEKITTGAQSRPVVDRSRALRLGRLSHVAHRGPARWSDSAADGRGQGAAGPRTQSQQCGQRVMARPRQSRALHHLRVAECQPADAL